MALEYPGEHPLLWTAVESMVPKTGCVPQTLLRPQVVIGRSNSDVTRRDKPLYVSPQLGYVRPMSQRTAHRLAVTAPYRAVLGLVANNAMNNNRPPNPRGPTA